MSDVFGEEAKVMAATQIQVLRELSIHTNSIREKSEKMLKERKVANKIVGSEEKARAYCDKVRPFFEEVKYHSDKLEILIDDELWPLPKLRELLFTR